MPLSVFLSVSLQYLYFGKWACSFSHHFYYSAYINFQKDFLWIAMDSIQLKMMKTRDWIELYCCGAEYWYKANEMQVASEQKCKKQYYLQTSAYHVCSDGQWRVTTYKSCKYWNTYYKVVCIASSDLQLLAVVILGTEPCH